MHKNRKRQAEINDHTGYSLYELSNINQNLVSDCEETYRLREQIKIEKSTYGKVNKNITQTINKVENQGAFFASRLEEQRHKYETLSSLVNYYEKMMYEQKLTKYEDNKNKKDADQYEVLRSKVRQTQKCYDQIVLKSNSSSYEVTKKIDQVRMLRSERAIFNGLFDQLQRQLFEVQLNYKQMVIERSFLQNIYKDKTQQFQYIQKKTEEEQEKLRKKLLKKRRFDKSKAENINQLGQPEITNEDSRKLRISPTKSTEHQECSAFSTIRLNKYQSKKQEKKTNRKMENQSSEKAKTLIQIEKVQYEKKVKEIMYSLEIKKVLEIPVCLEHLQQTIKILYDKADFLYERMYEKQERLKKIKDIKPKPEKSKSTNKVGILRKMYQEADEEKNKLDKEMRNFTQSIEELGNQLKLNQNYDDIFDSINEIDENMVLMFPKIHLNLSLEEDSCIKPNQERLNIILSKNKTTKNTAKIYSEEDLIAISKFNLRQDNPTDRQTVQ